MRVDETLSLEALVRRLKQLLEEEPGRRGQSLQELVAEKDELITALESKLSATGVAGNEDALAALLAPVAFSNSHVLRWNRMRLQLAKLGRPMTAPSSSRVDLTT